MIIVLYGGDELNVQRRLRELKEAADGGTGMLATNLTVIEAREAKAADIINPSLAPPFLAPKRVVVVDGFLDRFQGQDGRGRSIEAFQPLLKAFEAGLPESSTVILMGGREIAKNNPMLAALAKAPNVSVEEKAIPKMEGMLRFIRDEAAARGIRFKGGKASGPAPGEDAVPAETDPAQLLANLHPGDTLSLANELDKLALYTMGRDVTVDDVNELCGGERETTSFAFRDAVMDGDMKKAFASLATLRKDQQNHQGLLALLADGYRSAAKVVEMVEDGRTPEEIGKVIPGGNWPNLRDRAIGRAKRLGRHGVRAAFAAIVETDRRTKLGEVDEDLGFELLVTRLGSLAPLSPGERSRQMAPWAR